MIQMLIAVSLSAYCTADELQDLSRDDAASKMIQKLKDFRVHGVGVSQPDASGFNHTDILDWRLLSQALLAPSTAAEHVIAQFPAPLRAKLADAELMRFLHSKAGSDDLPGFQLEILVALRKIVGQSDFYNEKSLRDVEFSEEMKSIVKIDPSNRTRLQSIALNRQLLTCVFPKCLKEMKKDYHSVPVSVRAGRDVVLVLSSNKACRWQINLDPGASVKAVVLCGFDAQEIDGVDCPVIYRALRLKDGSVSKAEYFYAHAETEPTFEKMKAGVKKITGREFDTFEGRSQPDKKPFVVNPQ